MALSIKFTDNTTLSALAVNSKIADKKETLEIIFDAATVSLTAALPYYNGADTLASTIVITDENGNEFTHKGYNIPVSVSLEGNRVALKIAKPNDVDTIKSEVTASREQIELLESCVMQLANTVFAV